MRTPTFILTVALSSFLLAAGVANGEQTKITGCLTKATGGDYTLIDESGRKVTVKGPADLEKHAANHKVTLHGTQKMEDGKSVFQVDRVEHVSDSCVAPTGQ